MAISVLDVRDTFAVPHVTVPARASGATAETAPRRLPLTIVSAGSIGVLQAVGLLAVALTGLDGVLSSPSRPAGWVVGGGLLLLAAWIVLCAGSGAALIDGAGRKLLMGVAYAELVLVAMFLVIATSMTIPTPGDIPVPVLGLMAVAVPVGKLLLVAAPSAQQWVAAGPRARVRRADPVQTHRLLATVTLGIIGLTLTAVAVLAPVQTGGPNDPASAVFTQP
jgi:hypothetical protein